MNAIIAAELETESDEGGQRAIRFESPPNYPSIAGVTNKEWEISQLKSLSESGSDSECKLKESKPKLKPNKKTAVGKKGSVINSMCTHDISW